jgi:predicted permease
MRLIDVCRLRLRSMLRRSRIEEELSSELNFHLEQQIAESIASGTPPEEARRAAQQFLGNVEVFKEECRDARGVEWASGLLRDVRYAIRTLIGDRSFAVVAVLSLGLGIGVNTALFSVIDAVMLKALPVAEPERLVAIDRVNPRGERDNFSYPLFEEIRDRMPAFNGVFAALHGTDRVEVLLPDRQSIVESDLRFVSAGYFQVLGVQPAIGRLLAPEDHVQAATAPGVVISHRFWSGRLNRDVSILGKPLTIGRQLFTVLGVSPPEFFGEAAGQAPDVWAPVEAQPILSRGRSLLDKPNVSWLKVMARLAPGVDEAGARAALNVFFEQLKAEPGRIGGNVKQIRSFQVSSGMRGLEDLREAYSRPLRVLMVSVGVVLLIACANVANLLLARSAKRQREIAIRLALGAKRARVIRQLMTENLCIAIAGGVVGVLLATWITRGLLLLASQRPEPLPLNAGIDARVLLFTAFLSMASSILFGIVPAIRSTRSNKSLTITSTSSPRQPLGRVLVVTQVAMCIVLLSAAGLFVRTLHNLRAQDLGFQPEHLLQVRIDPQGSGYKPSDLPEVYGRVLTAVRSVPGVLSASMSHSGFNTGMSRTCCIAVEGHAFRAGEDREVRTNSVLPDYFETVRLSFLLGRTFTVADVADRPRVVIISKSASRRYFATTSPIGKRIGWGDPPNVRYEIEIVGVVDDLKTGNLRDEMRPILYFPANGGRVIHARTAVDTLAIAATIRRAIQIADSNVPVNGIHAITAIVESSLVLERLMATLAGFFGILALCLAAVGLYGVVDYSVRQRTQEIGVRIALGAPSSSIIRMISREVTILLTAGIVIGAPATLAFNQILKAMLFGVDASDRLNIAVAACVLALTGVFAAIAPSRRAASVNPVTALRYE